MEKFMDNLTRGSILQIDTLFRQYRIISDPYSVYLSSTDINLLMGNKICPSGRHYDRYIIDPAIAHPAVEINPAEIILLQSCDNFIDQSRIVLVIMIGIIFHLHGYDLCAIVLRKDIRYPKLSIRYRIQIPFQGTPALL